MDLKCNICAEPWDSYGVNHGDMLPWEAALFKKGAGCPSCQGVRPDNITADEATEAHLKSVVFGGTDDPDSFPMLFEPDTTPPKWERPKDEVIRKCESCGDKAVIKKDVDDGELYWEGATYNRLHHHGVEWKGAITSPEAFTLNEKFYCPSCVSNCADCGKLNFSEDLHLPEGKYRQGDAVCEDCLHNHEDENGSEEDDEGEEGDEEASEEEEDDQS